MRRNNENIKPQFTGFSRGNIGVALKEREKSPGNQNENGPNQPHKKPQQGSFARNYQNDQNNSNPNATRQQQPVYQRKEPTKENIVSSKINKKNLVAMFSLAIDKSEAIEELKKTAPLIFSSVLEKPVILRPLEDPFSASQLVESKEERSWRYIDENNTVRGTVSMKFEFNSIL